MPLYIDEPIDGVSECVVPVETTRQTRKKTQSDLYPATCVYVGSMREEERGMHVCV
jgi:hypothetical protein